MSENKKPIGFFKINEDGDGIDWDEVVNSIREANGLERLSHEELNSPVEEGIPSVRNSKEQET